KASGCTDSTIDLSRVVTDSTYANSARSASGSVGRIRSDSIVHPPENVFTVIGDPLTRLRQADLVFGLRGVRHVVGPHDAVVDQPGAGSDSGSVSRLPALVEPISDTLGVLICPPLLREPSRGLGDHPPILRQL